VSSNRLPTDEQMRRWREEGLLLCTCARPMPWPRPVWGSKECRNCGHLILGEAGRELLARRAQLVAKGVLR
jgi:hypothetical protein